MKGRNILMKKRSKEKSVLKVLYITETLLVLSAVYTVSVIAQTVPGVHRYTTLVLWQ